MTGRDDRPAITTISGRAARPLGLAGHPEQRSECVRRAFEAGIKYYFFYGPGHRDFIRGLRRLLPSHREELIVATGSSSRTSAGLRAARRRLLSALGWRTAPTPVLDIFFAEYVNPNDDQESIFGEGGVLDELSEWKARGWIRYAGATAHDRLLAARLATDRRVDVLMHRFNMAHRKAVDEVFPAARASDTPVVAFTATRWRTLLSPPAGWRGKTPSAADCYRFCLAHSPVVLVLSAPRDRGELDANLAALGHTSMTAAERRRWQVYGDRVRSVGSDAFETKYP